MSYAKFLANAAWAGLYVTLLAAALLVLINGVPPGGSAAAGMARAAASLAPIYLPATALLLSTLFVFLRFFAVRRLHARWQSLKAIVWFGVAALGGFTAVAWMNLRWIGSLLSPAEREALRLAAGLMAGMFVVSCGLASVAQFRAGREARRLRVAAVAALLAPLCCLTLFAVRRPAAAAGPAPESAAIAPLREVASPGSAGAEGSRPGRGMREAGAARPGTVPSGVREAGSGVAVAEAAGRTSGMILLGIDAASMDQVLPLAASGNLPSIDRIMRRGASSRLNTLRPCDPEAAWSALLTGRPPWASGRRGAARQSLPLGPSNIDLMPRALGLSWLRRAGYVRSTPHAGPPWGAAPLWAIAASAGLEAAVVGWDGDPSAGIDEARVASRIDRILEDGAAMLSAGEAGMEPLRRAVASDLASRDAVLSALGAGSAPLVVARFPGLADMARRCLRYHAPDEFGEPPDARRDPRARVITGYYEFLDEILGEVMERSGDDRHVMVVSSHGVEPLPVWERLAAFTGLGEDGERVSGSWRRGPDGVFLFAGPGVLPGARPEEIDLLDVAPTAVYLMGLPLDRQMRSNQLRRLFQPEFLETHPLHFAPAGAASPR